MEKDKSNLTTYLLIFAGIGAFVLIMQSRSSETGKSFLGIGTTPATSAPWYEKLGAGAGAFFGGIAGSLWGKPSTSTTSTTAKTSAASASVSV